MTKRVKKSNPALPVWLTLLGLIALGVIIALLIRGKDVIILNPKGLIANQQIRLGIIATLTMLEIVIPSLLLFYYVAWKYRESNEKAERDLDAKHGKFLTFTIWTLPTITVILLGIILIPATHKLEPQKQIAYSSKETLTIQVVAMRWKWLFIYPDQNIATVNYVQIPEKTPVQFEITADETPMSSFWIPHLGGQLYAMTEHVNRLNIMADSPGDSEGIPGEINGKGFAGMRFKARVSAQADFDKWVIETGKLTTTLNNTEYTKLLVPSENNAAAFYASPEPELYSTILSKYGGSHHHETATAEHEHEGIE